MHICYLDESGCTGQLTRVNTQIQPVFAVAGLMVDHRRLTGLTYDFLHVKQKFYSGALDVASGHFLDSIKHEIKGSDLRKKACCESRRQRRHSIGVLDSILANEKEASSSLTH